MFTRARQDVHTFLAEITGAMTGSSALLIASFKQVRHLRHASFHKMRQLILLICYLIYIVMWYFALLLICFYSYMVFCLFSYVINYIYYKWIMVSQKSFFFLKIFHTEASNKRLI